MKKDEVLRRFKSSGEDEMVDKIKLDAANKSLSIGLAAALISTAIGTVRYGLNNNDLAIGIIFLTYGSRDFIIYRKLYDKKKLILSIVELILSFLIIYMYFKKL